MAPLAPSIFEAYATNLHRLTFLPLLELGLLATALIHITCSVIKSIKNRQAGNNASLKSRRANVFASLAARSQALGGLTLLFFLVLHLTQLRWPRPAEGGELEALQVVLTQPINKVIYLAASIALCFHLYHGGEAAHRSLGLLVPRNAFFIRHGFRCFAFVIGGGFILVLLLLLYPELVRL